MRRFLDALRLLEMTTSIYFQYNELLKNQKCVGGVVLRAANPKLLIASGNHTTTRCPRPTIRGYYCSDKLQFEFFLAIVTIFVIQKLS
jgi:hypothetical protein